MQKILQHTPVPAGFNWMLTNILYIFFCKRTLIQETKIRPTGWTLSYPAESLVTIVFIQLLDYHVSLKVEVICLMADVDFFRGDYKTPEY